MLYFTNDLGQRVVEESWILIILAIKIAAVLGIICLLRHLYQRYQHTKDLMMSKQEVKEVQASGW